MPQTATGEAWFDRILKFLTIVGGIISAIISVINNVQMTNAPMKATPENINFTNWLQWGGFGAIIVGLLYGKVGISGVKAGVKWLWNKFRGKVDPRFAFVVEEAAIASLEESRLEDAEWQTRVKAVRDYSDANRIVEQAKDPQAVAALLPVVAAQKTKAPDTPVKTSK